jgi:DNA-binding transcriptional ArsR family regulator
MNAAILSALAEPNRLGFIALLRDGPRPVGGWHRGFGCARRINMNTCAFLAQLGLLMCGRSHS